MNQYLFEKVFEGHKFSENELNLTDFETCNFLNCNFSEVNFIGVVFIDCVFKGCLFSNAKINHVALRTVLFDRCTIENVNFSMCDKLIFDIRFKDSVLNFSKFYTLKIKKTSFENCSLVAVDFMKTDLSEVVFDNCDLYRAEFDLANATKTNFKTSINYTIDPTKTKIKKAQFSLSEVKGLLFRHNVLVE